MILNFTLLNERIKALEHQAPTAPAVEASLGMLLIWMFQWWMITALKSPP
jgi:hypothetical protein